MASRKQGPAREFVETGHEPEYVANHTTYESAPGGNIRGFVWKLLHGKYVLQYTFVASATELVSMGRQAMQAGADGHNLAQWEEFPTEH